jgi:hypothetical protein
MIWTCNSNKLTDFFIYKTTQFPFLAAINTKGQKYILIEDQKTISLEMFLKKEKCSFFLKPIDTYINNDKKAFLVYQRPEYTVDEFLFETGIVEKLKALYNFLKIIKKCVSEKIQLINDLSNWFLNKDGDPKYLDIGNSYISLNSLLEESELFDYYIEFISEVIKITFINSLNKMQELEVENYLFEIIEEFCNFNENFYNKNQFSCSSQIKFNTLFDLIENKLKNVLPKLNESSLIVDVDIVMENPIVVDVSSLFNLGKMPIREKNMNGNDEKKQIIDLTEEKKISVKNKKGKENKKKSNNYNDLEKIGKYNFMLTNFKQQKKEIKNIYKKTNFGNKNLIDSNKLPKLSDNNIELLNIYSFNSVIENNNKSKDKLIQIWDKTRLPDDKITETISKIKKIWPTTNNLFSEEYAIMFLSLCDYNTEKTINYIQTQHKSFIDFCNSYNLKVKLKTDVEIII